MPAKKRGGRPSRGPIASAIAQAIDDDDRFARPKTGTRTTRKGGKVRTVSVRTVDDTVKGTVYVLDSKPNDITVRLSSGGGRYADVASAVAAVVAAAHGE